MAPEQINISLKDFFKAENIFNVICDNPQCGTLFQMKNFLVKGSGRLTMTNGHFGPCPCCGGFGTTLNGNYTVSEKGITFDGDLEKSFKELLKIRGLLNNSQNNFNQDKNDLIHKTESISPSIAEEFKKINSNLKWNAWLGIAFFIVAQSIDIIQTEFKKNPERNYKDAFIEYLIKENERITLDNIEFQKNIVSESHKKEIPPDSLTTN